MKRHIAVLALVALCLNTPLTHSADEQKAPPGSSMDPPIAGAPAPVMCSTLFAVLDANKDGFIGKDESRKSPRTTEDWSKLDVDLDDRLAFEEFCPGLR